MNANSDTVVVRDDEAETRYANVYFGREIVHTPSGKGSVVGYCTPRD